MSKRIVLICLAAAMLFLCSCGAGAEETEKPEYVLYFLSSSMVNGESGHGSALGWEPYSGAQNPRPEDLIDALLAGPTQEELTTPFPKGVSLCSCTWDEERPGVLFVSLSEQYGALTDISLTLADYCIVLTLSQLDEVEGVEIRSGGYGSDYRSHPLLKGDKALLADPFSEQEQESS